MSNEQNVNKERNQKPERTEESPFEQLRNMFNVVVTGMEAFRERANEIRAIVGPVLSQVAGTIQKIPTRTINLQRNLAERGWYIMPEMPIPDLFALEDAFAASRGDIVDNAVGQMVESSLSEVESQLVSEFPSRASIFKEAFEAHRDSRYASAITLLLTQADGICSELFGVVFFSTERGTDDPRTRKVVESLQLEVFEEIMLEPVMTRGGVSARDAELTQYPDSLHRHQILHGKDVNYASKINSLKAISLVGYLGGLAKQTLDDAKAKKASVSGP
jgi:hypothetical protein